MNKKEYSVKEIQAVLSRILKQFAEYCDTHNLRYYAFGGTCLGAVRHHGFIPWDDDVDVAMPREDYEKLADLAKRDFPENLRFVDSGSFRHYECMFGKIHDINTTKIELHSVKYPDRWMGVSIDIMPLDGLPADEKKRMAHVRKINRLHVLNHRIRFIPHASTFKGHLLNAFARVAGAFLPYHYFSDKAEKLAKQYPFSSSEKVFHTGDARGAAFKRIIIPREYFESYIMMDYDDYKIRVPERWHEYLSFYYGADYMTPPPPEKRTVVHDIALADMEKSYMYYVEEYKKGELEL